MGERYSFLTFMAAARMIAIRGEHPFVTAYLDGTVNRIGLETLGEMCRVRQAR